MKIKLLFFLLTFFVATTATYASFPVKRTVKTTETTELSEKQVEEVYTPVTTAAGKDKWVAAALWFVLGGFAAHRWYIGSPWYWNVLYIITLGYFFVGHIIDIVQILTDKYPGL